ncbi:MAG: TIGR02266 family protein [Deltaproteobacteria bacterium]|nr:TIGR02266 family protein [Deltaproteobacteria bacterium]
MPYVEHRRDFRLPVELKVGYRTVGSFITDYILNISRGGIFVTTQKPLPIGTRVRLVFSLPDFPLPFDLAGEVRWVNPPGHGSHAAPGMGIGFSNLDENARKRIERFIKNTRLKPPPLPDDAEDEV